MMEFLKLPKEMKIDHEPVKCIKGPSDIMTWQRCQAYVDLLGFINGISTVIQGMKMSSEIYVSENMQKLLDIFGILSKLVDNTPPIAQENRFGNKAFRDWCRLLNDKIMYIVQDALPEDKAHHIPELGTYIRECFGNSTRIDYGTGHELSFMFFLCALFKAGILKEEDSAACALKLFNTYLLFVRRLQQTYRMEPAGSQGVWSLDDYQFIPFIWGSAQLSFQPPFDPPKFLDEQIINEYKDEYMFISCIDYISKVKTGHFAEHSNQLWSISAVPSWMKINSGLVKMYQKEVLSKYPVMQHVYFGPLMPFAISNALSVIPNARLGFKVPASSFTASDIDVQSQTNDVP